MQAREGPSSLCGGITVIDPGCRGRGVANFKKLLTPASTGWRVEVPVWPEGAAVELANFCLQGQGWSLLSLDVYT